jgi:ABC-type dipeptide/oligopeptide/nickel transport system permease subunit
VTGERRGDAAATGIGSWVWVAPAVVVICVNLVGDGLDTALDPMLDVRS